MGRPPAVHETSNQLCALEWITAALPPCVRSHSRYVGASHARSCGQDQDSGTVYALVLCSPAPFRVFLRPKTCDTLSLLRLRTVALAMRRLNHSERLNSGRNHSLQITHSKSRTEDRNELERGNSASIFALDAPLPCLRGRGDGCAALPVPFRCPFTLFHASFASAALNPYVISLLTA